MSYTRIYHPQRLNIGDEIKLSSEASHHVLNVLRCKVQQKIVLFDGSDNEYLVEILCVQKKIVAGNVLSATYSSRESPLKIHLAQGIAKGDRMTFSLQKAIELGVTEYTPLWTQHAAFKWDKNLNEKKLQQWQAIMVSACEQSGRNFVPKINPILSFQEFIISHKNPNKILVSPYKGIGWQQLHWEKESKVTMLIGPEGGFSVLEAEQALLQGYQPLTIGPRILRTETAVISALTLMQAIKGDL